jgi:acyl CoA:acetate/3-ketoacid CoA transferase alpha subunit/acyl CoA:acetate/3-ketoacid CoA transferase beta subunit
LSSWREVVARRIVHLHDGAADKRMDLAEAVRRFVRPGMKLNAVTMQARPQAAMYELCRRYSGSGPGFEFISSALSGSYLQLAHLGLLRKAVVSFAGEGYPTPGPSPVARWALERGDFEIENWTMLTIAQRLLAGAMGVPFLSTRSITGSSLATERRATGNYAELPDPFEPGRVQGVISAYRPDIAFVHVWAADRAGNAICFPPFQENVYGALAAREGVVLTAHKVVSTDFIRRHSHLVRIPGGIVLSVSEVPYGSHPYGNYSAGIAELRAYANDYAFMKAHREAQATRERYDDWIGEWILGTRDQEAYLAKLGKERLQAIHRAAEPDSWQEDLQRHSSTLDQERPAGQVEEMIVQAAREVARRIATHGYRAVLAGAGQASLVCWLAAHRLRDEGVDFALLAETGMYGFDPRPGDPFLTSYRNLPTCTMLTDVFEALGLHGCGGAGTCMGTIGAGEIDKHGNVNSTTTATGEFLVGSGGANDIVTSAAETVVVAVQRAQTFVERVGYVTSPGTKVRCVISTAGRFEKLDGDELVLTGYFAAKGRDQAQMVAEIRRRCGWDLKVSDELQELPPSNPEELNLLRVFDPERFFLGKPANE